MTLEFSHHIMLCCLIAFNVLSSLFQNGNLLTIFQLCKDILKTYAEASSSSLSRVDTALFIRYLSLAEQVLNWNFVSGNHILQFSLLPLEYHFVLLK